MYMFYKFLHVLFSISKVNCLAVMNLDLDKSSNIIRAGHNAFLTGEFFVIVTRLFFILGVVTKATSANDYQTDVELSVIAV